MAEPKSVTLVKATEDLWKSLHGKQHEMLCIRSATPSLLTEHIAANYQKVRDMCVMLNRSSDVSVDDLSRMIQKRLSIHPPQPTVSIRLTENSEKIWRKISKMGHEMKVRKSQRTYLSPPLFLLVENLEPQKLYTMNLVIRDNGTGEDTKIIVHNENLRLGTYWMAKPISFEVLLTYNIGLTESTDYEKRTVCLKKQKHSKLKVVFFIRDERSSTIAEFSPEFFCIFPCL